MYNISKKEVWYGELRTARGNTVLIYDNQFPEASAGRVYFYNTVRDEVIEYAEDIVKSNLHDLDDAAIQAAKSEYGKAWKATRLAFMDKHDGWVEANNPKSAPVKKAKPVVEPVPEMDNDATGDVNPELEAEGLEAEFDTEWPSDDFDD
ncbi:hypothetical protein [Shewanella surugensis]|uniref:Uncharacterized protein n=1 Tax=Shewanella surugensis TaxID=212020 RepID=A0ABT0LA07_9GAMM|nr:hypothetical protein [Shewanella surugensis]MCL1124548.1 hypothetical protein [Shewanella surugensis]